MFAESKSDSFELSPSSSTEGKSRLRVELGQVGEMLHAASAPSHSPAPPTVAMATGSGSEQHLGVLRPSPAFPE